MKSFGDDLSKATVNNTNYRKVVWTGDLQLVLMSLKPLETIPGETHPHTTQFIKVEKGRGVAVIGRRKYPLKSGVSVIVPPGTYHEIKNNSKTRNLQLYTIYTPAEHKKGLTQRNS